eukprot:CCRYP_016339-RA/>CCRYP_016339-RA protein AED:0.53 eAED:-0.05 QI:0/0/0/1/1/1/2/0/1134
MADPPNVHRTAPTASSTTPNDTWKCKCSTLNSALRKRCSTCMGWRHGRSKSGGQASIVSDEGVGAAAALSSLNGAPRCVGADGAERPIGSWRVLTLKNDSNAGGNEDATKDPRSKKIYHRVSLQEAASLGCQKCKKEYETGKKTAHGHDAQCPRSRGKTDPHGRSTDHKESTKQNETRPYTHHRVSLEEAASLGCRKCKMEYETGLKNAKSHDAYCPRSRSSKMGGKVHNDDNPNDTNSPHEQRAREPVGSLECKKCKDELKTGKKVMGRHSAACSRNKPTHGGGGTAHGPASICCTVARSTVSIKESIDDGDPPWRRKGNAWIGRRVLYRPKDKTHGIRSCSKTRFYDDDIVDKQKPSSSSAWAAKGTILGFISERDKDSKGNPGFVSSRDGRPAKLFHVVFDKENPCFLLNKDFEEWEIKEQCEWIDDESEEEKDVGGVNNNDEDTGREKSDIAKVSYEDRTLRGEPMRNNSSTNACSRRVTFSQDSDENIKESTAAILPPCGSNTKSANDSSVDGIMQEEEVNDSHCDRRTKNSPNLSLAECSSFNEALKSALCTYASTSALRGFNNPPPPMPPPFLSHQEESTLRTALAFVMIKARNKKKDDHNTSVPQRLGDAGTTRKFAAVRQTSLGHESLGWMSSVVRRSGGRNERYEKSERGSSLLGGLVSLPQGTYGEGKHNIISNSNVTLTLDREMNHIRDILKLALSSVMPLYRGALELNDKVPNAEGNGTVQRASAGSDVTPTHSKRHPSAIYDFEAGYNPLFAGNASQKSMVQRHYASLDGLCQHAISRLARVMKCTALKSKIQQRNKITQAAKTHNEEEAKAAGDDLERHPVHCSESVKTSIIASDIIVKLFYEDVIGNAYNDSDGRQRRLVKSGIEKIMAACHVIHRMLFLDQSCCFATELVIAISRSLADLYNNNYSGLLSDCVPERSKAVGDRSVENKAAQLISKDKVQVVGPSWLPGPRIVYAEDRNVRRSRSIDAMFCDTSLSGGTKRKNQEADEMEGSDLYLPRITDVLAVNLLRLLECVAAIRLHHRQKMISCYQMEYRDYMTSKAESTAATEILTEIRSTNAVDLTLPVFIDDAAALYLRESIALHASIHRKSPSLLRPCAKLMLRLHLFGLIKKLSSYEQA